MPRRSPARTAGARRSTPTPGLFGELGGGPGPRAVRLPRLPPPQLAAPRRRDARRRRPTSPSSRSPARSTRRRLPRRPRRRRRAPPAAAPPTSAPSTSELARGQAPAQKALSRPPRRGDDRSSPDGGCPMKLGRVLTATMALAAALLLCGSAGAAVWRVPGHFPTIQAAIDSSAVEDGDVLRVLPGRRTGATVTKARRHPRPGPRHDRERPGRQHPRQGRLPLPRRRRGQRRHHRRLPLRGPGLPRLQPRRGRRLRHPQHDARSPTRASRAGRTAPGARAGTSPTTPSSTCARSCGGGIGILIGDYAGGTVSGNLIAHNEVRGRVRVPSDDCGGYGAPGVVLFADWRYAGDTGATITGNRVTKNRVFLSSTQPALVPVSGVELSRHQRSRDRESPATRSSTTTCGAWPCPWTSRPTGSPPVNRIEKNLTGPVAHWPDRALERARARGRGPEAAPVR